MKHSIVHASSTPDVLVKQPPPSNARDARHARHQTTEFGDRLAVSILDAAAALGCGRSTVYTLIAESRLETIRIGRRHLVVSSSIVRFVEGARRGE